MPKVALIGAGSVVFANNLVGDLLTYPQLKDELEFSLMDIDPDRLEVAHGYIRRRVDAAGAGARVEATLNLEESLRGADYVVNMIQVGGLESTLIDFDIPEKYGLQQTIADTHGIGGVFRALRTIPAVLEICRRMEELCPESLLINYSNPMAMVVWAVYRAGGVKVVGLCHSIPLTALMLANYLDLPFPELRYRAAGTNHLCWFLELRHRGRDLYPDLHRAAQDPMTYSWDRVRFEIMKRFGYFVSESSEHMAEYVPYFIPHRELVEKLHIPLREYVHRCYQQDEEFERNRKVARGEAELPEHYRTLEYAAPIIWAMESGEPALIYGNVENRGLISNLPYGCCVEVPCLVDGNGVQPLYAGELPPQLAAINRAHISVQELAVQAVLEKRRDYVYYACQLDPLAASMLTLDRINELVGELLEAHRPHLDYLLAGGSGAK